MDAIKDLKLLITETQKTKRMTCKRIIMHHNQKLWKAENKSHIIIASKKTFNLLWFRSEVQPHNIVPSCFWKVIGWWRYWHNEWTKALRGSSLNGLSECVETVKGDYEWMKHNTGSVLLLLKGLCCPLLCSLSLPACQEGPCPLPCFHLVTALNNESRWPWMKTSEMMRLSKLFPVYVGYIISSQYTCQKLRWYMVKFHIMNADAQQEDMAILSVYVLNCGASNLWNTDTTEKGNTKPRMLRVSMTTTPIK